MNQERRTMSPTPEPFIKAGEVATVEVSALEGHALSQALAVTPMLVGRDMMFMEVRRPQGVIDPEHSHDDHESICYLVSGRMRVVIAGEEFLAEPGDVWIHGAGVAHYHEALEDSLQIEIKSPPRRTWPEE